MIQRKIRIVIIPIFIDFPNINETVLTVTTAAFIAAWWIWEHSHKDDSR